MMKRNIGVLLAALGAFSAIGPQGVPAQGRSVQAPGASQPVGSTHGGAIRGGSAQAQRHSIGYGPGAPRYRKRPAGPRHLTAKRLKRQRRNRLRAKGQFRKAQR